MTASPTARLVRAHGSEGTVHIGDLTDMTQVARVVDLFVAAHGAYGRRRRDCHFAAPPSSSLLKRLLQRERGCAQNDVVSPTAVRHVTVILLLLAVGETVILLALPHRLY